MKEFKDEFEQRVAASIVPTDYDELPDWHSLTQAESEAYEIDLEDMPRFSLALLAWWEFTDSLTVKSFSEDITLELRKQNQDLLALHPEYGARGFVKFADKFCGMTKADAYKVWCKNDVYEINRGIMIFN
jgi:hypothetical protein